MVKRLFLWLLMPLALLACPFDEDDSAVTIDAHKAIMKEVVAKDFDAIQKEIVKQKELYSYFSKQSGEKVLESLQSSAAAQNGAEVKKWLDRSLALEVKELVEKVNPDIANYTTSRLLLVKAKKHLKALTDDEIHHEHLKKILKSLGNPGLMGAGKEDPDLQLFESQKNALLKALNV